MKGGKNISRLVHGAVIMIFVWSLMSVIYHHAEAYPHYHLKAGTMVSAVMPTDRDGVDAFDAELGMGIMQPPALDLHHRPQSRRDDNIKGLAPMAFLTKTSINAP